MSNDITIREARFLLQNLLTRLEADAAAERPLFGGVVSDAERHALRILLAGGETPPPGSSEDPPTPVEPPAPRPSTRVTKPPIPAVELNTDVLSLSASPEPSWVLCLDFGTAKSKAFAATDDEEEPELEPLPLG